MKQAIVTLILLIILQVHASKKLRGTVIVNHALNQAKQARNLVRTNIYLSSTFNRNAPQYVQTH